MTKAVNSVATITSAVFTVEVLLKLVIEGFEPMNYFRDKENGSFNTFDAVIVAAGCKLDARLENESTPLPLFLTRT